LTFAFYSPTVSEPKITGETIMSESLNDVAFGHDLGLDLEIDLGPDLELQDTLLDADELDSLSDLPEHPVAIRSISNSPGCTPASQPASRPASRPNPRLLGPIRQPRSVRVDAWAVPASANWSRTRRPMRKVKRISRSTDWALPF
jgi:hypothetical protein